MTRGGAAARAAAAKAAATTKMPTKVVGTRVPETLRDLKDIDELEGLLFEKLRDWQLQCSVVTFNQICAILESEVKSAKAARVRVDGDLRAEGYEEGRVNAFTSMLEQFEKAAKARADRIGIEVLK